MSRQEFLTPTKAAKLLGVCHVTIYNYINRGVIKVWKLKRKTLIRRANLDALFKILSIERASEKRLPDIRHYQG
ncbi:helix-turn-helix domain-containing protein [uncultured Muribaculum sp.]|uniref:helix-turn-helix domain-containing protein n=1 Tax=uncultured Muribaculum sp. TaxID=1918613 RepID=UPI0034624200